MNRHEIKPRPEFCTEQHVSYVAGIRAVNTPNMFGVRSNYYCLMMAFQDISKEQALSILDYCECPVTQKVGRL